MLDKAKRKCYNRKASQKEARRAKSGYEKKIEKNRKKCLTKRSESAIINKLSRDSEKHKKKQRGTLKIEQHGKDLKNDP